MRDDELANLFDIAAADIEVDLVPAATLADAGRRRQRRRWAVSGAAAAVLVLVGGAVAVAARSPESTSTPTTNPSTSTPTSGQAQQADCVDRVPVEVLPAWARAGFSETWPHAAYLLGDDGDIAAILFSQPLTSPPRKQVSNKILWVAYPDAKADATPVDGSTDLHILARLDGGSTAVARIVAGGPGPSIIDLPQPGCWHLSLQWGPYADTMSLLYAQRP
jgi:hypothetical protein